MTTLSEKSVAAWPSIAGWTLLTIGLAAASVWRYWPWMPGVFFGDDLTNYVLFLDGGFASTPFQALTGVISEKYRPVFALAMWAVFSLFGPHIEWYLGANVLVHVVNALMVFSIARRLSRGSLAVAVCCALLASTTRLALYQVTQITGLLEGIGQFVFLAMIYCLVRHDEKGYDNSLRIPPFAYGALVATLLLVHDHERYLPVVPWVGLMLVVAPNSSLLPLSKRIGIFALSLAPIAVNVWYKVFILHSAFFVGTGGTHIALDWRGIKERLVEGALSLVGFNYGPDYLVGRSIAENPETLAWKMALFFAAGWLFIIGLVARNELKKKASSAAALVARIRWPLMSLVLMGLLVLPPVLTIRMEQRWLVQPFLLLLLISAWAIGALDGAIKRFCVAIFVCICAASATVDTFISKSFTNIFFVFSARVGEIVKRDVVDAFPPDRRAITLVARADVCGWILIGGQFFRLYGGQMRSIKCVDDERTLSADDIKDIDGRRIFLLEPGRVVEIGDRMRAASRQ